MNNYLRVCLFALAVFAANYLAKLTAGGQWVHPANSWCIAFFAIRSLAIVWAAGRLARKSRQAFVLFTLGSIPFRLLISLVVAVAYLVANGSQSTLFITSFFGLYLLFFGFELVVLMTNLRTHFEKRSD